MLFKIALIPFALLLLVKLDFSLLPVLFFSVAFLYVYFSELPEIGIVKISYLTLTVSTVLGLKVVGTASALFFYGLFSFSLILFWVLLHLVNFHFKDRFLVYGIFNVALLIQISTLFFYFARLDNFILPGVIVFFSIVLLFKEVFVFFGASQERRVLVLSVALGLIILELSFFTIFLPLGFINSAALIVLFSILIRDAMLFHVRGYLNFDFIFRELAFLIVVSLVILASSNWSI
ncbi:MAG: hypothetical protein AAB617_03315 [Patescibacteria group bacterium]